jgi:hypothetical protein
VARITLDVKNTWAQCDTVYELFRK